MAESSSGRVTWLGHSTVLLEEPGSRILTDPLLRRKVLHLRRHREAVEPVHPGRLDAVLISHHHFDHFDRPSIRAIGRETAVVGGPGTAGLLRREGFRRVVEISPGEAVDLDGTRITATPADHGGSRTPLHRHGEAVGFIIEGSSRVYFAGDTDLFPELPEVAAGVDLALLPVWGWGASIGRGHLDPERAARAVSLIAPRLAVPIHWGTLAPFGMVRRLAGLRHRPAEEFLRQAAIAAPGSEVRVLDPGGSTSYP